MNTLRTNAYIGKTVVNGLAIAGFIALVGAGMWLAIYAARFAPTVVNGAGSAAVYLGSLFTPAPRLSVVSTSTAPTTIYFGEASSTISRSAVSTIIPGSKKTIAGNGTSGTYQIGGVTSTPALYGFSDLTVNITAVGYLTTASTDSFVAASAVPAGSRPAVTFTIKNIGTNATGSWRFSASIPTQTAYIYQSLPQQSLLPGDSIDYTLGFDQANKGTGQTISITANFDHAVSESNTNNNSASAQVTILGN